ncbi:hypothetical protein [Metabacillus sp. RGM 3146]|uniref:hypothetical protein n=1 Tax=Metabacillus sp. RGM 3146 TaxID=3401092 RepID=UPI003B9D9568
MIKINTVKFGVNLIMALTFVLLFNKQVIAGLTFHDIAGLVIGGFSSFLQRLTGNG